MTQETIVEKLVRVYGEKGIRIILDEGETTFNIIANKKDKIIIAKYDTPIYEIVNAVNSLF